MAQLLTFEYSSVHGSLAAAYACGALAAEFGPERVRAALAAEAERRGWRQPLLAELSLAEARQRRLDTRLLGLVSDGDGPVWALVTSHVTLAREAPLLVRALSAVLQARPHRPPLLGAALAPDELGWAADEPLRAASILIIEDFVAGAAPLAA
ncbi:MAG: hypothetical protein ABI047_11385 [Jatrophihabitantaceae bacterium]